MIGKLARAIGVVLLWLVIALALGITFLPSFLDRIYYTGPHSDHYDGAHFSNPDGEIRPPFRPGGPAGSASLLSRFLFTDPDRPVWPDHVRVWPAHPAPHVADAAMRAVWVGHASFLIQAGGINILTDPIWSDHASPLPGVGPRRVAEPGIGFADLPKIDIVVISHNHYDHMDLPTLQRLWERDRPLIVTSLGNEEILAGKGIEARALDWGQSMATPGGRVHVVRNHHWSSRWGKDRNRALWSAFVIETPAGRIFFAGDTGAGDMRWVDGVRALGPIRLALLPIGAFRFYPGQMENDAHIGPQQAVEIFRRMDAAFAIPMHYGTFRMSNEGYDTPPRMLDLFMACSGVAPAAFAPHRIGEPVDVPATPLPRPPAPPSAAARAACAPGSAQLAALK